MNYNEKCNFRLAYRLYYLVAAYNKIIGMKRKYIIIILLPTKTVTGNETWNRVSEW